MKSQREVNEESTKSQRRVNGESTRSQRKVNDGSPRSQRGVSEGSNYYEMVVVDAFVSWSTLKMNLEMCLCKLNCKM